MIKLKEFDIIGHFKVQSEILRISDPCYGKDTWCAGTIEDVKKGTWNAYTKLDENGNGVSELLAFYKDISSTTLKNSEWIENSIEIGVDSGQCGIFDDESYPNKDGEDEFYRKCCDITTNEYGVLDFGVVSSSGMGDGVYTCYTIEDANGVVGVKIVFIEEDEITEDDEYGFREDYENRSFEFYNDED